MLKACWDCIASSTANREPTGNEEAYGIHLNGDAQRAPPWPELKKHNEKMFLLPKVLQPGDRMLIKGQLNGYRQTLSLNLLTDANGTPDYGNIACQVDVRFAEDTFILQSVTNQIPERDHNVDTDPPSNFFTDSSFEFLFSLRYNRNQKTIIEVEVGGAYLGEVDLKHNIETIRYLSVYGDVEKINKLEFEFA